MVLKRLPIILLIVILVIGQFGYYCFYAYKIHTAKELAKENILKQIPVNLLNKISIDENPGIHWEEKSEFSLDNKMYDVVRVEIENGKKYLLCVSDDNEDALIKKFSGIIDSNKADGNNTGKNQLNFKFQQNDMICSSYNDLFQEKLTVENTHGLALYTPGLRFTDRNVNVPPPKI